jgi:CheY-like chemotaxis protein
LTAAPGEGDLLVTILVVDDAEVIVSILRRRLEHYGYTVLEASDGRNALKVLDTQRDIDLVITGINMPSMNGFDLGKQLKTKQPDLPVIYMSAFATNKVMEQAQEQRIARVPEDCAFLAKPFSEEQLLHAVRTVLSTK